MVVLLPASQPTDSNATSFSDVVAGRRCSDGRPVQVHEVWKDVTEVHELLWGADEEGLMLPREARLEV